MDEVIFEEFKGTGNSEIVLDRKVADKRIFPAIDVLKSGTRKEELITPKDQLQKTYVLRRILNPMGAQDADRVPARQAAPDQDQRRLLPVDEHLGGGLRCFHAEAGARAGRAIPPPAVYLLASRAGNRQADVRRRAGRFTGSAASAPVVRRPSSASWARTLPPARTIWPISIFTAPDSSTANRRRALSSSLGASWRCSRTGEAG